MPVRKIISVVALDKRQSLDKRFMVVSIRPAYVR